MRRGEHTVLANLGQQPWSVSVDGYVALAWDETTPAGDGCVVPPESAAVLVR
jgi:hypothetical protein